jgi:hypothetical protein
MIVGDPARTTLTNGRTITGYGSTPIALRQLDLQVMDQRAWPFVTLRVPIRVHRVRAAKYGLFEAQTSEYLGAAP